MRALLVVPVLNEAAHIDAVLSDLLQGPPDIPIRVADGGSTDGTQARVRALARLHPRLHLVRNPARLQAAAVNDAARTARAMGAGILIRADAHARYRPDFVARLLDHMQTTGADSVTVPLIATGQGGGQAGGQAGLQDGWAGAAAALQTSALGTGGSAHRHAATPSGWATHGHHAAFRLDAFLAAGGYDTAFPANEDAEFDRRLTARGGRIWFAADCPVAYLPRTGPCATFRQYLRNGRGRAAHCRKHGRLPAPRQLAPAAAVFGSAAGLALAPLAPLAATPALLYGAALLVLAARAARLDPTATLRILALAAAMHGGFALGLATLLRPGPAPRAPVPA